MTTCSLWVCSCCMPDLSVGWAGSVQLSCLSLFEFYIEGLMRAPFICSWKSNRLQAAWSCRVGSPMSLGLASRASLSHYITWASTLDNDALLYSVHLLLTAWKYSSQIHSLTLLTRPPPSKIPKFPPSHCWCFCHLLGGLAQNVVQGLIVPKMMCPSESGDLTSLEAPPATSWQQTVTMKCLARVSTC